MKKLFTLNALIILFLSFLLPCALADIDPLDELINAVIRLFGEILFGYLAEYRSAIWRNFNRMFGVWQKNIQPV